MADAFYAELGGRIADARRQAGITQADLAAAFGLTRSSIANLEAGRQHSPVHAIVEMAAMLGFEIPGIEITRPPSELVATTFQRVKADRDRMAAALVSIIDLAHEGRWATPGESGFTLKGGPTDG